MCSAGILCVEIFTCKPRGIPQSAKVTLFVLLNIIISQDNTAPVPSPFPEGLPDLHRFPNLKRADLQKNNFKGVWTDKHMAEWKPQKND